MFYISIKLFFTTSRNPMLSKRSEMRSLFSPTFLLPVLWSAFGDHWSVMLNNPNTTVFLLPILRIPEEWGSHSGYVFRYQMWICVRKEENRIFCPLIGTDLDIISDLGTTSPHILLALDFYVIKDYFNIKYNKWYHLRHGFAIKDRVPIFNDYPSLKLSFNN